MMESYKKVLKKIPGLVRLYKYFRGAKITTLHRIFRYDRDRLLKYAFKPSASKEGLMARIIMAYHIVEKGLTMPEMRLGFGRDNLLFLISALHSFAESYGMEDPQFRVAVSVVAEYNKVHEEKGFKLDAELENAIKTLLELITVTPSRQITMTRESYWRDINASFEVFSASRHSVRNFEGTISMEQIRKAISIANNAPSACNRQFMRVHCVTNPEDIQRCLSLQNGNRGFGHLVDKLLILTADLRGLVWMEERNDAFTNAGIYLMNLCYALHHCRVAHCLLNWSVSPAVDYQLHTTIDIPGPETIVVLIACGGVPERFKVTSSPKKSVEETLVLHI